LFFLGGRLMQVGDDGAHSTNEKLDLSNYISGIKLLGAYLHEIAAISA
jgi:Cys-Gly metallodipeptidase DUG1